MPRRMRLQVSFDIPEGSDRESLVAYVIDAVACMKGAYHPEDPIFDLDGDSVRVYDPVTKTTYR